MAKNQPLQITQEEFECRVRDNHKGQVKVIGVFTGILKTIEVEGKCGHRWRPSAQAISCYRRACPVCPKPKNRSAPHITDKEFRIRLKARRNDLEVLDSFQGVNVFLRVRHKVCGHVFKATPNGLLWRECHKKACPSCTPKMMNIKPLEEFLSRLTNPNIRLTGKFEGLTKRTTFLCLECRTNFEGTPARVATAKVGCPSCVQRQTGYKRTLIIVGKKKFSLQGNEPMALEWMLNKGIKPGQIQAGKKIPTFKYHDRKKERTYYPDFYLTEQNRIVEVKSTYTLAGRPVWLMTLKKKRQAVLDAGFRFNLLVFRANKDLVNLPRNWYDLSYRQIKQHF
jgi:hypothetical protein